ncbi:EpsG family protein [Acinetobacter baumannii]|uniref:EpsG family protein n=1 Tax=Acinetobacter baumannii TaxID=470 RepID=UPI003891661D
MFVISGVYRIVLSLFLILALISIPSDILWDRNNYLYYAENADKIIRSYDGIGELLFNDYVFLEMNRILAFSLNPENIVLTFLVFSLAIFYFLINKFSINFITFTVGLFLSILITPILHLEVVAIRQALGMSVILLFLVYSKNNKAILVGFLVASLIHSSFFLLTLLFFLDSFLFDKFEKRIKILLNFATILTISICYLIIASYLGFRQVELYASYDGSVSGGTFIVVLVLFIYLYFYYEKTNYNFLYNYVLQGFLLFLIFYIFSNAIVSARFLESIFPAFILLLVNKFRKFEVIIILFLFLAYGYVWFNNGQYIIFEVSQMQADYALQGLL